MYSAQPDNKLWKKQWECGIFYPGGRFCSSASHLPVSCLKIFRISLARGKYMIKKSVFVIVVILILICMVLPQSNDINLSIAPRIEIPFVSLSQERDRIYTFAESQNLTGRISFSTVPFFFIYGDIRL